MYYKKSDEKGRGGGEIEIETEIEGISLRRKERFEI
jgi:hypothetical protein